MEPQIYLFQSIFNRPGIYARGSITPNKYPNIWSALIFSLWRTENLANFAPDYSTIRNKTCILFSKKCFVDVHFFVWSKRMHICDATDLSVFCDGHWIWIGYNIAYERVLHVTLEPCIWFRTWIILPRYERWTTGDKHTKISENNGGNGLWDMTEFDGNSRGNEENKMIIIIWVKFIVFQLLKQL